MSIDWQWVWSVALGLGLVLAWAVGMAAWQWLRQSKQVQEILTKNEALKQLALLADSFVASAQASFADSAEKRQWVLFKLAAQLPGIDEDLALAALEKAVAGMKERRNVLGG